ncbi:glucose-6-phosphate isomerase [Dethiothermospora halolimnae]|uniref:glucose-6-phosphate isomerase n=1 Tax=Dethiothermospora halolimnae TaxID=3114390 RepID=UPI003CCB914C
MGNIYFDYSRAGITEGEMEGIRDQVLSAHDKLHNKSGLGNDYLGWLNYPSKYNKDEYNRIKEAAENIKDKSDIFLVVGIGGSYLGARAAISALNHSFYNQLSKEKRKYPSIYFVGNSISGKYMEDLLDIIKDKDISLNVISKSGTTTETAIAFRVLKEYMEKKYGKEEASKRIYATTDKEKGALKKLSKKEGYETFTIPDDVGGRYSIFTAVGLLPMAVSGIDIDGILKGAYDGMNEYKVRDINKNYCYQYAATRNILNRRGKDIEILVNYEPSLEYLSKWWIQLYGESEGKDNRGIFPSSVNFSTDLHSLGQYIQQGRRILFETTINIEEANSDIGITKDDENLDGLNYLAGETMDFVNNKAFEGTVLAHIDGNVPNLIINVPNMDPYYFGKLIYFFEKACGISGYILGVNPFNQPGVESYKKNMFALLGKPGFEKLRNKINSKS